MEGLFLQSAEAFSDSPLVGAGGEIWELLQAEKEQVSRDILAESDLRVAESTAANEAEPSEESPRAIEWHNRETLEDRLRELNDAQDRLIDGSYGMCLECGDRIEPRRLVVKPAASLCISCQELLEGESIFRSL
ncbi:MAG TPA: TraR/DksA family transcriptional regulator [Pyrinomonadaceae bacterium]|nr:TraR/DksA family transcriptional regulator [Pyrinomonadaceae bacterium]